MSNDNDNSNTLTLSWNTVKFLKIGFTRIKNSADTSRSLRCPILVTVSHTIKFMSNRAGLEVA